MNKGLMHDLFSNGFVDLLPIIPPGAEISPKAESLIGREHLLGKIPGRLRAGGWVGFANWVDHETTLTDIEEWSSWYSGVGLRCKSVVAVDIDVTDPVLVQVILDYFYEKFGKVPSRSGNDPKILLLFLADSYESFPSKRVMKFTDFMDDTHMIEVLGARQQFVVAGVHPKTKKRYSWDCDVNALRMTDLPVLEASKLAGILLDIQRLLEKEGCIVKEVSVENSISNRDFDDLKSSDMDLLHDAVLRIPNTADTNREYFIKMAHAIRAAAIDFPVIGETIFTEWADKYPDGQMEGEVSRVYNSVQRAGVGIQWILDESRKFGFDYCLIDLQVERQVSSGKIEWEPEPVAGGDEATFWNKYVYINSIKRFMHMKSRLFLDKEQFSDVFPAVNGKFRASELFIETQKPGTFADRMTYLPGNPSRIHPNTHEDILELNTWLPGPLYSVLDKPHVSAEVDPWLDLVEHIAPNKDQREVLLDWIASLIQRPLQKPNWHPLIGSTVQGIGKDSIFAPVVYGLGHQNVSTIGTQDIENQWSHWAEGVQLVIVSEIASFERRAVANKLKSFMAAPPDHISINVKNMAVYDVPNRFGMVFFTNDTDGVAVGRHDRRFFVIWSDANVLPSSVYDKYYAWLRGGGRDSVLRYLMTRDISSFSSQGVAPMTDAKQELIADSAPPIVAILSDAQVREVGPFTQELFLSADAMRFVRELGVRCVNSRQFARYLMDLGCISLGRARVDGSLEAIWCSARAVLYQQIADTRGMGHIKDMFLGKEKSPSTGEGSTEARAVVSDFEVTPD